MTSNGRIRGRLLQGLGIAIFVIALLTVFWPTDRPSPRQVRREGPVIAQGPGLASPPVIGAEPRSTMPGATGEAGPGDATADVILAGRVVRDSDGDPVHGATVYAATGSERQVPADRAVSTDEDGSFRLLVTGAGPWRVFAFAAGLLPAAQSVAGASSHLEVRLSTGASIEGVVLDDAGKRVPGARVWCHSPVSRWAWPTTAEWLPATEAAASGASTVTNDEGQFHLSGLHPGEYELRTTKAGYLFGRSAFPPIAATGSRDIELVLCPLARLEVVAVDAGTGERIRTASMSLRSKDPMSRSLELMTGEFASTYGTFDGVSTDGGVSRVTFGRDVAAGGQVEAIRATVAARAPGYAATSEDIVVPFGETTRAEVRMLRLESTSTFRTVRFVTSWENPEAFSGPLMVRLHRRGSRAEATVVTLRFSNGVAEEPVSLPPGDYLVHVSGNEADPIWRWWTPAGPGFDTVIREDSGEQQVALEIAGNPVELTVVDAEGRRVHGFDLHVDSPGMAGVMQRWDIARSIREGGSPSFEAKPIVWIPRGSISIGATMPGLGGRTVHVLAPGDGRRLEAIIQLTGSTTNVREMDPLRKHFREPR